MSNCQYKVTEEKNTVSIWRKTTTLKELRSKSTIALYQVLV